MKEPRYYRRFSYDKALLPNRHLASLEKDVTNIDQARKSTGATIGYPGWNVLYSLLLSHLDPNKENIIVETGTNVGCSTIILAQALKDSGYQGKLHTIEIDPDNHARALENIQAAQVDNYVVSYLGDSLEVLPNVMRNIESIRIAFLDGAHTYQHVLDEFDKVLPKLDETGIVVFDNTYEIAEASEDPRVHGALTKIQEVYGGNIINLEFVSWYTPGLAMWQKTPFRTVS